MPPTLKEITVPAQARKMPIKTVTIKFDEIEYEGWEVTMRTNPRADVYDKFLSSDEDESWDALGELVVEWNFVDEEGNALSKPHHETGTKRGDLPYDVQSFLIRKYVEAFNAAAQLPKPPADNSGTSSTTNASGQEGAKG